MFRRSVVLFWLLFVPLICQARPSFPLEQLCNYLLTEVQKEVTPKLAAYTHKELFFVSTHDNSLSPIMNDVDWIRDLWIQGRYSDSGMFGVKAIIFLYDEQSTPVWIANLPTANFSMKVRGGAAGRKDQAERANLAHRNILP